MITGVVDGRFDPLFALPHGPLGQTNRGKGRETLGDIYFNLYNIGINTYDGAAEYFGYHNI